MKRVRKKFKLQLELDIMKLEEEEPRKKVHKRPHKSNVNWNMTPKVTAETKKYKKKQSIVSSDSTHGSQNTGKKSYVADDVQPQPKSIRNCSKRAKVIQSNNAQKDDYTDNFRRRRLRSNHEQSVQYTGKLMIFI